MLERAPPDDGAVRITRGGSRPRAIAWFGFTAFWGHLRHLIASAIATENIDSRQWMVPDPPEEILHRALVVLGAKDPDARTLAAGLGGEVWIDFVADTGDCVSASKTVAKLFSGTFEVPDPDDAAKVIVLPRGDVLFHGGDIAYPVATVREITRRVLEPWNEVLRANDRARLLLGIPGNHDWYDGLDGFARLCQAPCDFENPRESTSKLPPAEEGDELTNVIEHPVLAWAEAFARGVTVRKPDALTLNGYVPVQRASYFRMPLARGLELFGVDRQLRRLDGRQRAYFQRSRARAKLVVLPDPVRAWGELRPNGLATAKALDLDLDSDKVVLLAGDVHHYERSRQNRALHVVAGGGGAFLHGARSAKNPAYAIEAEFPGPRCSKALLWRLPLYAATGRSGWLLVLACALAVGFGLWEHVTRGLAGSLPAGALTSVIVAAGTGALVSFRKLSLPITALALLFGALIGFVPLVIAATVGSCLPLVCAWAAGTFASAFFFGLMLVVIARLGLNHAQPYAALGVPGYRHFVRLRVRETERGSIVDGWVIGCVDPVGEGKPVLVDSFRWVP